MRSPREGGSIRALLRWADMHQPSIATIDLNLLRVFDSVFRERSIQRAAQQLGMSQPAASHALGRLRHALKDDLFVRSARGMLPTPRAEQLAGPIKEALSGFELALQSGPFDPVTSTQSFTIALDNASAVALTAPIVAAAADAAGVRINLVPSGTLDVDRMIDDGGLDLFIGRARDSRERFASEKLFSDDFVVLHNPARSGVVETFSLGTMTERPHLQLSSAGDDTSFIDTWLRRHGAQRTVRFAVPLLGCESVLRRHDALIVMRRRIAAELPARTQLAFGELPFQSPRPETCMRWHRRVDAQPAHIWLRQIVRTATGMAGSGLDVDPGGSESGDGP